MDLSKKTIERLFFKQIRDNTRRSRGEDTYRCVAWVSDLNM